MADIKHPSQKDLYAQHSLHVGKGSPHHVAAEPTFLSHALDGFSTETLDPRYYSVPQSPLQNKAGRIYQQLKASEATTPEAVLQTIVEHTPTQSASPASPTYDITAILYWVIREASLDSQKDRQLHLERIETYQEMRKQMNAYTQTLQEAQKALHDAMVQEKNEKKRHLVEIVMPDQRAYLADYMNTLSEDGKLLYQQLAISAHPPVNDAQLLVAIGSPQKKHFWSKKLKQSYKAPNGQIYEVEGETDAERRNSVLQKINQQIEKDTHRKQLISNQGLSLLITRHTQDCEQLQKRTDQEQARFQSASERQNQMIAACSSLLKNKHDIISMINRHLV